MAKKHGYVKVKKKSDGAIPIDPGPAGAPAEKLKHVGGRQGAKPHIDPKMDRTAKRLEAENEKIGNEVNRLNATIRTLKERIEKLESVHPRDIDPTDRSEATLRAKVNMDFQKCLQLPPGILRTPFRRELFGTLHEYYPALHRSAARMLFEGQVPGFPALDSIISNLPIAYRRDFCDILDFMDLLETFVQRQFLNPPEKVESGQAVAV